MIHVSAPDQMADTSTTSTGGGQTQTQRSLTLAELQDLFQRAVMDGDAAILKSIPGNGRTTADVLLGVYQYAYRGRLADILGVDYPLLQTYMGPEAFEDMAYAYITAHPSNTPNVRWFGRHLARFLKSTPPFASRPDFCELAALEHALGNAFDAADDPVLQLKDLEAIPPESWGILAFKPHSSSARMTSDCAIYDCWHALQNDDEPSHVDITGTTSPQHLIVWRKDEMARVRIMGQEEAMMWDEASRGVPFGRLCELVATYDDPDTAPMRAAQYLQAWISAQLLTSARTTDG